MAPHVDVLAAVGDRYRVEREIARGGGGVVYAARDLRHGRAVAIKVIGPEVAGEVDRERFVREIETVARLSHPHILPLYDSGSTADSLYFVMPLIEGESLRARLERERRLPVDEALRLAGEVADALEYAHGRGVIHRDVKPENILLSSGHALLADFGISRAATGEGERLTRTSVVIGTPRYMSPEQWLGGGTLDARSDVYSLACVLHEMLAGDPPYAGGGRPAQALHLFEAPTPLRAIRPDVPPAVERAVLAALAKAPADRPASAAAFARALREPGETALAGAAQSPRHGLPAPLTSFVGRESELRECRELLRRTRLLTLLGPGGCGKTRLAIRVAEESLGEFAGRVWFVDLASTSEPARVPQRVADAVGVRDPGTEPLAHALAARLGEHPALLVLDNCEPVLEACSGLIEELLRLAEPLRVIATSREVTGLAGEMGYPVAPLAVPPDGAADLEALGAIEAVRLFVERARLVAPGFALRPDNATAVSEICRRLDGIPLAIELAAARARVLSVEEIRTRLKDRFRLLTGGRSVVSARHQTLRGAIQWSYDHLPEDEQRLFRALAVFAGGWTLAGAVAVNGGTPGEFETLDRLARLAEQSLLQARIGPAGRTRYRFLETIREFALERLAEAGEEEAIRGRHLDYCEAFVAEPTMGSAGEREAQWLARMAEEHDDLLAALSWCDRVPNGATRALRMTSALTRFWLVRAEFGTARRMLERALARSAPLGESRERADALRAAGDFAQRQCDFAVARELLDRALAEYRTLGDRAGVARTLNTLGVMLSCQGDAAGARAFYEQSLEAYRAAALGAGVAMVLTNLGVSAIRQGDLASARGYLEEGVRAYRATGDPDALAGALVDLGVLLIRLDDRPAARARLLEAIELIAELRAGRSVADALEACSELAACEAQLEIAARLLGAAEALRESVGLPAAPSDREALERSKARLAADLGPAAFAAAIREGASLGFDQALAESAAWLRRPATPRAPGVA
jgi:non-specific serine/threonine protein kinase